jgi:hypothetical protein
MLKLLIEFLACQGAPTISSWKAKRKGDKEDKRVHTFTGTRRRST